MNNHRPAKDRKKLTPSGVAPRQAFSLWDSPEYNAEWCLTSVGVSIVEAIMDDISGGVNPLDDWGVPPAFVELASQVFERLHLQNVTMRNVWHTFLLMLPHMHL